MPPRAILLLTLALWGPTLLEGCSAGPDYRPPAADVPERWPQGAAPERPVAAEPAETVTVSDEPRDWWRSFGDPMLDALVERARAANLDLRAAVLRVEETRAERATTAASWWPSLSADASYSRTRLSEQTPTGSLFTTFRNVHIPGVTGIGIANPYSQYQLGAAAAWEPDLFGRIRRSVEAADAAVSASVEDQHAAQLALLGDVARSYLELRAAQESARSARASIEITAELVELARQRRAAGLSSEVDVIEAGAELSTARSELPAFDLAITESIHTLSRLAGEQPEALRDQLSEPHDLPVAPARLPAGLPASLARRRPDIRHAEDELHLASAQIGLAVAGLYPRISLSLAGGMQSQTAGELTSWASRFFTLGPTLELPLFDQGRWRTIRLQRAREKEAAVAYAATVLRALQEVEDALAAVSADQARQAWLVDSVRQDRDVLELSRQRYASGVASFIEVLDAERTLRQEELALIRANLAVDEDLVAACRALGGDWD